MPKFNFNLRNPKGQKTTPIQLVIRWNNQKIVKNTSISIIPKFWDTKLQKIKNIISHPQHHNENRIILDFKEKCEECFLEFQKINGRQPNKIEFKEYLDNTFEKDNSNARENKGYFIDFAMAFIDTLEYSENPKTGRKYANTTIRVYKQCIRILNSYEKKFKTKIKFDDIDMDFYKNFRQLMREDLNFKPNTAGKHIGTLKTIMNEALESGKTQNRGHLDRRFIKPIERVDSIYLTNSELMNLYKLDLSANPRLERVRDTFVFHATQTGLRPIDWHRIKSSDFHTDINGNIFLRNVSLKTRVEIIVPIHGIGLEILKKYKNQSNNSLPALISDQKANQYIKEICRLSKELNIEVDFKSNEDITNHKPKLKWEYVENRTARRSFATNHVKLGMFSTQQIMMLTGHRSETSFMRYLKLTTQENANSILKQYQKME
jgi:integrase